MNILDEGVAFRSGDERSYPGYTFPGICIIHKNRWLCTARAAKDKATAYHQGVRLSWSDDEGRTWSRPVEPFLPFEYNDRHWCVRAVYCTPIAGEKVAAVLCCVEKTDPDLPFFNEETEGLLDTIICTSFSTDAGASWTKPQVVNTSFFDRPVPLTGPLLLLHNGELACQFELNKDYYDETPWEHSSVMLFSKDHARSWYRYSIVTKDTSNSIFYWDQRPGVMLDGGILDLFWTYDSINSKYLNIHAKKSSDHGANWSELWDTKVPGQPAQPVMLDDGSICMVYVDREDIPVIKARVSYDEGLTWPGETEYILAGGEGQGQTIKKNSMQDAWSEMGRYSIGLPAAVHLGGNEILVVYYSGKHTDHTDIKWIRFKV